MDHSTRRHFLKSVGGSVALSAVGKGALLHAAPAQKQAKGKPEGMRIGLVTYLWGQDWDLPTLFANCQQSKVLGLELRTQHAHGV